MLRTRVIFGVFSFIVGACGGAEPLAPAGSPSAEDSGGGPRIPLTPPAPSSDVEGSRPTRPAPRAEWMPVGPALVQVGVDSEPSEPPPPPSEPVYPPDAPGPYAAGVMTLTFVDPSRNRELPVEIWYPVTDASSGEDNTYEILGSLGSFDTPARRNGVPAQLGPRPLVVFSHGFGGIRFQSYFLTEHLATHGFVVAAPDHVGNLLTDFTKLGDDEAVLQSSIDRPLDVLFVRDRLLSGADGFDIDPTKVAVSGHSFGGWTTLEVGRRDPSISVLLPLAPGFRNGVTVDFVANLTQSIMLFGGTADGTCPYQSDQVAAYEVAPDPKALVGVIGAGHLDFSNLCDILIARLFVDDGCDPRSIDPEVVHDITKTAATAFLKRFLLGDTRYDAYLDASYVTGLGPLEYYKDLP